MTCKRVSACGKVTVTGLGSLQLNGPMKVSDGHS